MSAPSFGRRLTRLAAERPDDTAVVFAAAEGTETTVTYAELDRRSNQVARALRARPAAPEGEPESGRSATVIVGLGNTPAHLLATFGAWKLGASVLPLRHDLPAWERARLLGLVRPGAVIADWPGPGEDDGPGTGLTADALTTDWVRGTAGEDDGPLPDRVPERACMIATSGSTGRPKIVMVPGPGVYDPAASEEAMVPPAGSVFLTACPLYHTNGFRFCYPPILAANRVILMERFDAELALRLIERHGVTHTTMVPTMLQRILRTGVAGQHDLSSIRRLIYGAAPIPDWVVRGWLDLIPPDRFQLVYGGSENVGIVTTDGAGWLRHPGTAGLPLNCDLKIADPSGRELGPGQTGTIWLRPRRDGAPFTYLGAGTPPPSADGFWTFGDLGYLDRDGYLYVVDRRTDLIVSGGANVYPAEVEAALSEHPGVADSAVIGLPDPEWGQRVHAIVQAVPGARAGAEALRRHCRARLAAYKVPKSVEFVAALPRTSAGKINRSTLAAERTPAERTPAERTTEQG